MTATTEAEVTDLLVSSIGPACHELRGPLAAAYGFGKMLEARTAGDETTARYVEHVVRGCERLDAMLDSLAQLGRIAAGRTHPAPDSVHLHRAVEGAVAAGMLGEGVSIGDGDEVHVRADPDWLERALSGLMSELRYDDAIDLTVSWTHTPHDVSLRIVASETLPHADMEAGSSGLDTALARAQVASMGGSVDVIDGGVLVRIPRS
ncbi:MAG: HAMP domain-containing histidine kinase [Thermoleophilia bacterium]|nr:HAMP domain-containing histidine kinase [Thermoleophilia bacterium]